MPLLVFQVEHKQYEVKASDSEDLGEIVDDTFQRTVNSKDVKGNTTDVKGNTTDVKGSATEIERCQRQYHRNPALNYKKHSP